jgi:radical SAM superfamily enzyme YgiQ (UPF0313 family)
MKAMHKTKIPRSDITPASVRIARANKIPASNLSRFNFQSKNLRRFYHHLCESEKKVVFPALDWKRKKDPPISLAQNSILANLKRYNINVINKSWAVNDPSFNIDEVYKFVISHATKNTYLALGAYVWHEYHTQKLLHALKQNNFPGKVILGGPQISYVKSGVEKYYPDADIFIRGYAEEALAQLLLSHEKKPAIPGIHYAGDPDAGVSAKADLEHLPSPFLNGLISPQHFIRWETQRGCPFRCAFCQHRESDSSMIRRPFAYSRIMREVEWIISNPIIQDIAVLDPTFNSGPHYMAILDKMIEGRFTGKIALQCRIEMIKDEFLDKISSLNKTAQVVLEFGLQTIHPKEAKVVQRPNNMAKVEKILYETRKRSITTEVSLIFGLPQQTLQSFKASVQFCKDHEVPTIYAYPLMLLRGTPLHDMKHELGLIESTDIDLKIDRAQDGIPHVIASPSFTYADWSEMAKIAESLDDYNAKQAKNSYMSTTKMTETLRHTMWHESDDRSRLNKKSLDNGHDNLVRPTTNNRR